MGVTSFGFFFQAEDGIRDWSVTGVQTCALPISIAGALGAFIPWMVAYLVYFRGIGWIGRDLGLIGDRKSVV